MIAPVWVPLKAVLTIHDRQIVRHGGATGLRDLGLLESACARPSHLVAYGAPDLSDLAAASGFGIAKAHAFVDGNKRTAFVTAVTFLRLNGLMFRPNPADGVATMEGLATDTVSEADLAEWFRTGATRM
ncbi:type II toxin-antitoxin system death-on-curing family toxin [Meridianimarinicoccus roseus]|uniref:Type II toxin-antitoxin system death-on-curing family toxin n=1 Tax=Meridianimarinicoccus roseus TaxID=2072018 RepID=A0A2V2LPT2_9RHOB|nr:type II toxin-antitoxin system death-on-curing family toxin [Meridianimarinicoccus roseus]PWR04229.1 type II toxin-antitoxin system death-on-curing family toxin [Meridianimarinicoccus roseus]